ncbi:MAG: hypothetical protein KUG77_29040 [Nannocystaceae bacterium]|nr:hypothetical protein [Nannocystaceae bacterium]
MFRPALTLFCALTLLTAGGCVLADKEVGGDPVAEGSPDPCESYCDRAAVCLGEDEVLCLELCPQGAVDPACGAAQLLVLSCLDGSSCEGAERACAEALDAREEFCGV